MGHSEHHKEHPAQAYLFVIICVGLLLVSIYVFGHAIKETAESVFDLSHVDLYIIPISGLAFFLFWRAIDKFLFAPTISLIEEREMLTAGAEVSAANAKEQTVALEAEYEEKLTAARIEGMQLKSKVLSAARSEAQKLIDDATLTASVDLETARTKISVDADDLRGQLMRESDDLVSAVVEKVTTTPATAKNSLT
jgi:F0F1-type ATP synthase membrane subunit b/b'